MLSASSPIVFPKSSPPAAKRATPHDQQRPKPKPRASGPFLDDDDSSDGEDAAQNDEPVAKRRMVVRPGEEDSILSAIEEAEAAENEINDHQDSQRIHDTLQTSGDSLPQLGPMPTTDLWATERPLFSATLLSNLSPQSYTMRTCSGKAVTIKERKTNAAASYESIVAARSKTKEGRAKRSYYGIEIHELINAASKELAAKRDQPPAASVPVQSIETPLITGKKPKKSLLWTEKYRARNFMDLCGDDGTNRHVLRWLKRWDPIVFPGNAKTKATIAKRPGVKQQGEEEKEKPHRKILMLTGPPGLGKTTLAHVCAKQAGYEVIEINASDDRSRDVVKNRIRTSLGTESVKNVSNRKDEGGSHKVARPACVIVDEVDGVVSGSGSSGEGGFVKALIDLVLVDQKNSNATNHSDENSRKKKRGDDFRLLRPLILICNDVYHPSLRPLRQSNLAEIIHVGRPSIDAVVGRLKAVYEKEGIPCEKDAARKLCEAAWGMTSGIDAKRGAESTVEGDLRGVMVVGEWVAGRFRSSSIEPNQRLTRQWIEKNVLHDLASGAAGSRGLGRGSVRDIVSRLFQEGGGFPKQAMDLSVSKKTQHEQPKTELGFGEQQKKHTMERLRQMVDTSGEISYIIAEIFSEYPNREFNDDCYLSKPNQAYEWLHFHDACQSRLYSSQDWELAPYLSQPVLAFHHLFASPKRHFSTMGGGGNSGFDRKRGAAAAEEEADEGPPMPFSGPRADYQANEAEKHNRSQLQVLLGQLAPSLSRSFRSPEDVATEFLPYLIRLVSPNVKPVVVGGSQGSTASVRRESEREMVKRASETLAEVGIVLQKGKIEGETMNSRGPQFVYRMEPDIDALSTFETAACLISSLAPTRFAVRQVLDQELQRTVALRENEARQARYKSGSLDKSDKPDKSRSSREAQVSEFLAARMPFDNKENLKGMAEAAKAATLVKRDFFGRIIEAKPLSEVDMNAAARRARKEERKVWVTFHEGMNNAVRKPISLQEFMRGL